MKEEWREIAGTKGEFFRGLSSGKVRHKSQMWKNKVFEDDWTDIPGYEGLYRIFVQNNRPIVFSIKRDKLLDGASGTYNLSKNGMETVFTERQLVSYVTRNTM